MYGWQKPEKHWNPPMMASRRLCSALLLAFVLAAPAQAAEEIFVIPPPTKDLVAGPDQSTARTLSGNVSTAGAHANKDPS